jgi:hypothetical protein
VRRSPTSRSRTTSQDYAELVTADLPDPWPGLLGALLSASELDRLWELVASERRRELGSAWLGARQHKIRLMLVHPGPLPRRTIRA